MGWSVEGPVERRSGGVEGGGWLKWREEVGWSGGRRMAEVEGGGWLEVEGGGWLKWREEVGWSVESPVNVGRRRRWRE